MKGTNHQSDPLDSEAKRYGEYRGIQADPRPAGELTAFKLKAFGFQGDGQLVYDWKTIREMLDEGFAGH